MVRHIIPVVILLAFGAGLFYAAANTTYVVESTAPAFIEEYFKDYTVKEFHVTKQAYQYPDTFTLEDVRLRLSKKGKEYHVSVQKLTLHKLFDSWKSRHALNMSVDKLTTDWDDVSLKDTSLKLIVVFKKNSSAMSEGVCQGGEIVYRGYVLKDVTARFKASRTKFALYEVEAAAYGGFGAGQLEMERGPNLNCVLWMELERMHPAPLAGLDPEMFGNLKGRIDANVRFIVEKGEVELMSVRFMMPEGGAMRRVLFDRVLNMMKNERRRAAALEAVQDAKEIDFDEASLKMSSGRDNILQGSVAIDQGALPLRVRAKFSRRLEQGAMEKFIFKDK